MAASPGQRKLASALVALKKLQDSGKSAIQTSDLARAQRESLVASGFLRPIVKGWYLPVKPGDDLGDTTPWFVAMNDFICGYCNERFGEQWHVSPEPRLMVP